MFAKRFVIAWLAAAALAAPAAAPAQTMSGGKIHVIGLMPSGGGPDTLNGMDPSDGRTFRVFASLGQSSGNASSGGGFSLVSGVFDVPGARLDLDRLHAFPVPFRPALGHDRITFRGTTTNTKIRIFTLSGWLVNTLLKNDPTSQDLIWFPVVNSQGQPLASGVYPYFADGDNSTHKSGKLMVIK